MKQFADDNFSYDENGRKLSKRVENTVGKGEIARYEQFLLSHSVFKRLVSQGRQKVTLCGNGLIHKLVVNMGKYLPKKGKVHENKECHKAQVIFADLSLLRQIFLHMNHKLIK